MGYLAQALFELGTALPQLVYSFLIIYCLRINYSIFAYCTKITLFVEGDIHQLRNVSQDPIQASMPVWNVQYKPACLYEIRTKHCKSLKTDNTIEMPGEMTCNNPYFVITINWCQLWLLIPRAHDRWLRLCIKHLHHVRCITGAHPWRCSRCPKHCKDAGGK